MGLFGRLFPPTPKSETEAAPNNRREEHKTFRLSAEEIKPIAVGFGGCIASDMIVNDGLPVRFMYRTTRHNSLDSGWCFLSGFESDAYMDDARNHGVYDINTIANYDPSITPFLDAPVGSAFEKTPGTDDFVEVKDWSPRD